MTENNKQKKFIPKVHSKLRHSFVIVPEEIYACSGITIFEKRIKSLLFTTDLAIIRNNNADSVMCVYPYTPQTTITQSVINTASVPCFIGVGGGTTSGLRTKYMALSSELDGAYGVIVNAPIPNEDIKAISEFLDIPVIATVTSMKDDIVGKVKSGAEILNVSGASQTPEIVKQVRELVGDEFPIIATGGNTGESIKKTIEAGANAISYTPLSSAEVFATVMDNYRK
ncbi:MAG: hydrolase [Peptoniphilaceae bacterium]|nr:hydrolase [Peptoniphilaceae bacterium]MDY6018430.1 hydrolase [Anaerococcus sp.]